MPLSYLAELSRQALPLRVTEPARVRLVGRLQATRQVVARFLTDENGQRWAEVLEITPLGCKILKCAGAREGVAEVATASPLPSSPSRAETEA